MIDQNRRLIFIAPKFEKDLQEINPYLNDQRLTPDHYKIIAEWSERRQIPTAVGVAIAFEMAALAGLAEISAKMALVSDKAKAHTAARIIAGIDWLEQGENEAIRNEIQQLTEMEIPKSE